MWLLNCRTRKLDEWAGSEVPSYTILSHVWSDEEVSYQDVWNGVSQQKQGYRKIDLTCEQSERDGFSYTWIDTCCIDKTSSAELSEAINSMFRWYAEASVCYAYLEDVSDLYEGDESRMETFAQSRYWTRGWTLQELIAPPEVEFFDHSWQYVSSRTSAAVQIARVTGIDDALLSKARGSLSEKLASYSVAQRLSWAAHRRTSRQEDQAYCLFGLFGVNMPLLYGEGSQAFSRLQEAILRETGDLSILAWPRDPENGLTPLARSAARFDGRKTVVKAYTRHDLSPFDDGDAAVTTGGLRARAPVVIVPSKQGDSHQLAMLLGCRYEFDITTVLALKLSLTSETPANGLHAAIDVPRLECSVGWSSEGGQDRLVPVDVLDAAEADQMKTIFIRQDSLQDGRHRSAILSRPRNWTRLWLRFENATLARDWEVLDMWPKQYWNRSNRTFDLLKARNDQACKDEAVPPDAATSTFGLPIFGAMALCDKLGNRIAVSFCQRSPSLDDGIDFEITPYDEKQFHNHRLERSDSRDKKSTVALNGISYMLSIVLRAVEISEHNVAVLGVSMVSITAATPAREKSQTLHGTSKVRGPLQLLRKHRGASNANDVRRPGVER